MPSLGEIIRKKMLRVEFNLAHRIFWYFRDLLEICYCNIATENKKKFKEKQDKRSSYKRNFEARWYNHCCRKRAISRYYIFSVCVCVCVCGLSHPAQKTCCLQYFDLCPVCHVFFYIISLWHDFRKRFWEYYFFIFFTTFMGKISYSKNSSVIYNYKSTVFMQSTPSPCQILIKLEIIDRFSKNTQISDFMKIHYVGAELFNAYRRTDR
jgi:hypothetical protein